MESLTTDQMDFLKKLSTVNKIPAENLSESDLKICTYLDKYDYLNMNYTSAGVNYQGVKRPLNLTSVSITEEGKAYLAQIRLSEKIHKHEQTQKKEFMNSVKQIAESAESLAQSADSQAKSADRQAKISTILSVIAILVSTASIAAQILFG